MLAASASSFTACAEGAQLDDDDDSRDGGADATTPDATTSSSGATSSGSSSGGSSSSSSSSSSGAAVDCKITINEIFGGSQGWIELYNPAGCDDVDLDNFELAYLAANSTGNGLKLFSGNSDTLPGGSYFVIGSSGDVPFESGTPSASNGQLALRSGGTPIDEVGYGSTNNTFGEGSNAPSPGSGNSIGRSPDGHDTDDNAADFSVGSPTQGAAND